MTLRSRPQLCEQPSPRQQHHNHLLRIQGTLRSSWLRTRSWRRNQESMPMMKASRRHITTWSMTGAQECWRGTNGRRVPMTVPACQRHVGPRRGGDVCLFVTRRKEQRTPVSRAIQGTPRPRPGRWTVFPTPGRWAGGVFFSPVVPIGRPLVPRAARTRGESFKRLSVVDEATTASAGNETSSDQSEGPRIQKLRLTLTPEPKD